MVVAVTDRSLNATIKKFLSELKEPVIRFCMALDDHDNQHQISYDKLVADTGCDPFTVHADADPATDPSLKKLYAAGFLAGFEAQLGIPLAYKSPDQVPNVVTFQPDHTSILLQLMCAEFRIVELSTGRRGAHWTSVSQGSGTPWLFTSTVGLRMDAGDEKTTPGLSHDVLAAASELRAKGGAFSVRRLLFDFATAALKSNPTIVGVVPGTTAHTLLTQYFLDAYVTALRSDGGPLLGAALIPDDSTASLSPTDVIQRICPPVPVTGQPGGDAAPSTLAMIAAVDGDIIPRDAKPFAWNWVDASGHSDAHGVIAVNRDKYAKFWNSTLHRYVESCCFLPHVRAWFPKSGSLEFNVEATLTPYQRPQVSVPPTGPVVLSFRHNPVQSEDLLGLNGFIGKFRCGTSFALDVSFIDGKIQITQHLVVYLYVWSGPVYHEGNIVDKTLVDTFELSVAGGQLQSTVVRTPTDNSVRIDLNWADKAAVPGLADWVSLCEARGDSIKAHVMQEIPVSDVSRFIFPAGRTFVFKEAAFSKYQDLVCSITYADPA
jgi:hypothetical protein